MLLQFISEPTIGAKERRLIRSHVMRGKNVGKSRQPKIQLVQKSNETNEPSAKDGSDECVRLAKHTMSLHRVYWNELSLTSYPCKINSETERFVYQRLWTITKALYPPEFCTEVILSKYAWFQYVLSDQAFFHCFLAIASSFSTHFGGPRHISSQALNHISQAYRMTNKRLSGSEACSDKAIAVVFMLAIYQRIHHQQSIGLVHFDGLRRMIDLRGGLAKLAIEHRALAQKPWRLALEFALQDGSTPAFSLDDIPQVIDTIASGSNHRASSGLFNSHLTFQERPNRSSEPHTQLQKHFKAMSTLDLKLLTQLASISSLTEYLNTTHTKLDPHDYSDAVCIRLHHLLDFATLNALVKKPLDNLVHLTLVSIMTTLLPEYGHNQARYDILAGRLRDALREYAAITTDMNGEVLLWAVFVGYATILTNEKDERWLISLGSQTSQHLGIHDWIDSHSILCRYGWIHAFYDKAGLKLLNNITEAASR